MVPVVPVVSVVPEVSVASAGFASAIPASRWVSIAWSIASPENSGYRTVWPIASRFAPASASVMLDPLPPRSTSTTTPRLGRPGAACSAASAAVESGISAAGTPLGARLGRARSAPRSAPTAPGPQCAGTAMAMGEPSSTNRASASRAAASTCSPRWAEPSAAISGTGSPTRSTKPLRTTPGASACAFPPTSGARSVNTVRIDRRITGGLPTRATTRLVVPTDNPNGSVMVAPLLSGPSSP